MPARDDGRVRAIENAMIGVGIVGATLTVALVVLEIRENGILDGAFTPFALLSVFATLIIEVVLAVFRGRTENQ